jgi:hypothetical protein
MPWLPTRQCPDDPEHSTIPLSFAMPSDASERARSSVRSRLCFTYADCQRFGCTTGISRPCLSRIIECTARLRNPAAQSRKFGGHLVVAYEAARHAGPNPTTRIGERRKRAVQNIDLETLAPGSFIGGDQYNLPAGYARIPLPEDAQSIARRPHLSALRCGLSLRKDVRPLIAPV